MYRTTVLLVLLCTAFQAARSVSDGLLPNGNFEYGPKPSQLKGTVVLDKHAIPNWELSGYVEYIKSGQKQGDMLLVVPTGAFAVRLGKDASIKQKVQVKKGTTYSITFTVARTCAQEEKLNVSVSPNLEPEDWGIFPMQTIYSSNGWDSCSWAFQADADEVEITIHNPDSKEEDAGCGPLIDSVALKLLSNPKRTRGNLLKNGNFEEGPYLFTDNDYGVLIPPNIEDDHSPLPGWIIDSLKAIKYIDNAHYKIPQGKRAVELLGGKESAVSQIVKTIPERTHVLTFTAGDGKNGCEGPMGIEAYAGKDRAQVLFESKGKGEFHSGRLVFKAIADRTRIVFLSSYYTMKTDGSLCGPVLDEVKLVSARITRKVL